MRRALKPRLLHFWDKVKEGGAILRDWRRYASEVALPSAASYCCRIGVNVVFMAAFSIPITAEDVAAFSITQDAILTIWNIVLGVVVMLWAFGYGAAKDLLFKRKKAETPAVAN